MLGSMHVLPGVDWTTGAIALTVFMAGALLAMVAVFGVVAFRRAGQTGLAGTLWRGGLILVGIILAWVMLDRSTLRDRMADRRAIDARAAELTARAIAPGSALACLDAVANEGVEAACERALFASPEAVAAAVAYVDARYSLLTATLALAAEDSGYKAPVERLRRAIEADRYGLVAHVLTTRGCASADCPDLKAVRDSKRIMANMRARTFDLHVGVHSVAWNPGTAGAHSLASSGSVPLHPTLPGTAGLAAPGMVPLPNLPAESRQASTPATAGGGGSGKFEYPSAASIPAISIMDPEPVEPAKPTRRPAQSAPSRGATSQRQVTPAQAPPAPQTLAPQTSGSR